VARLLEQQTQADYTVNYSCITHLLIAKGST